MHFHSHRHSSRNIVQANPKRYKLYPIVSNICLTAVLFWREPYTFLIYQGAFLSDVITESNVGEESDYSQTSSKTSQKDRIITTKKPWNLREWFKTNGHSPFIGQQRQQQQGFLSLLTQRHVQSEIVQILSLLDSDRPHRSQMKWALENLFHHPNLHYTILTIKTGHLLVHQEMLLLNDHHYLRPTLFSK